ncbi:MAG: sugar phosphate isomerase/epimerase [Planctomycetota bacterium]
MYTLRDHCETVADIAKTCAKVKAMGYEGIQASAAGFATISAADLKKVMDDTGLVCAATHMPLDRLEDVSAVCDWHAEVGCGLTALGGFGWGGVPRADWEDFAAKYSKIASDCGSKGLRVGYHNHSHEWSPFGLADAPESINPRQTPIELMVDRLDAPGWFELDVYWVAHGGGDPAAWIERLAGRVPALHYKDITVTPKREHKICEVGAGNLNWPRIHAAALAAGTEWALVERDQGDLDPFDSLQKSLDNIRAWG